MGNAYALYHINFRRSWRLPYWSRFSHVHFKFYVWLLLLLLGKNSRMLPPHWTRLFRKARIGYAGLSLVPVDQPIDGKKNMWELSFWVAMFSPMANSTC